MTTSNQQALTLLAVQEAAETLMILHHKTTTLEVKNYLRQNNYVAFQRDVSEHMSTLLQQQKSWTTRDNGRYKLYIFGQDSQDIYHEYLEKGNDFWEIEVNNHQQISTLGKIGTEGGSFTTTLSSNRLAIHKAKFLVQQKIKSGYVKAIDQRLSKSLRNRYQKWLIQKVQQCTLAFYGVEKVEKQSANLLLGAQLQSGYVLTAKSAGYEISFNNPSSLLQMLDLLNQKTWDATQIDGFSLYLTGEKTIHQTAFSQNGTPLLNATIQQKVDDPEIQQLAIQQAHLYQVRLTFDQHKTLTLSKFELNLEKELLPLVKAFFKTK